LPWNFARKVSDVKLSANDLRAKVLRCFNIESSDESLTPCPNNESLDPHPNNKSLAPHPNKWRTSHAHVWLSQHPITGEDDFLFIKRTIAELTHSAVSAERVRACEKSVLVSSESNWIGKYLMLCLIHALIDHDETKRAFHTCHNLPGGCMEVENRNKMSVVLTKLNVLMIDNVTTNLM
jgi:hypothetical protein